MSEDIHKADIHRDLVNPTLLPEYVSIWYIVQLVGHGAANFSLMPKEIQDRVHAEIDRRHKASYQKSQGPSPI